MSTMVAGPGPAYYNSDNSSRHSQSLDTNELNPVTIESTLNTPENQLIEENAIIMTSRDDSLTTASANVTVVTDFCQAGQYTAAQPPYTEFYPGEAFFPGPPLQDYAQHPSMCAIHGVPGPATVRMVSTNSSPPIPLPVQVPPGHIVQQIVDETGTLQHVILSTQPMPLPVCPYGPNGNHGPHQFFSPPPGPQAQGWGPSAIPPYQAPPPQYTPVMSPSLSQSSPPPHNYQKQDRNMGCHEKIRGKYNPKYQLSNQSCKKTCPNSFSPKKEILKKMSGKEEYVNGSLTPDPLQILHQFLSEVEAPEVYDITSTNAAVRWKPPDLSGCPEEAVRGCNISYEIYLRNYLHSSQNDTQLYLSKLKPGTEYKVHLIYTCNDVKGKCSPTKVFYTQRTKPETPQSPRLVERTKNSLFFRWPVPRDNGSKILHYIIEIKGGDYKSWTEIYGHINKQYNITKLKPTTAYIIRLAAVNDLGKSDFSSEVTEITSSLAPSQPSPPSLAASSVTSLSVEWVKRLDDLTFTLQMEDPVDGYGFRPVFNGRENHYTCNNLQRNCTYKFRICTQNLVGNSPFSNMVAYQTLSARPSPPVGLSVKGKPSHNSLIVCWNEPIDNGGTSIQNYELQFENTQLGYQTVYCGGARECPILNLTSGQTYKVRCLCDNEGGKSYWSDELTVTTRAVVPDKCNPPRLNGKPKATTLELKWGYPDFDGGSPITEFNLDIVNADTERRRVYVGRNMECIVASLLPGRSYVFLLRAVNKVGSGSWSETFEVVSGAGPPDAPRAPQLILDELSSVVASWDEPINNGDSIAQYCLQSCQVEENFSHDIEEGAKVLSNLPFDTVYSGSSNNVVIENLIPAAVYAIRVNASSNAGAGPWSSASYINIPATPPAVVSDITSETDSYEVLLKWSESACHGEPIQHYVIECATHTLTTTGPVLEFTVTQLEPETLYKFRIKAVNCVGEGPFSAIHKISTRRVPPKAPTIELVKASHNSLKLKWGDGRNAELLKYHLQMECLTVHKSMEFYQKYNGTNENYKITKLEESSTYKFRICASNEAGLGALSEVSEFSTLRAPPPPLKAPKASESQSGTTCISWNSVRSYMEDKITYKMQMMKVGKENDYAQVYMGPDLSYILTNLEAEQAYYVRVCAIRNCNSGDVMIGAYSSPTFFTTPKMMQSPRTELHSSVSQRKERKFQWNKLTENQKAFAMVLLFSVLAYIVAYFVQKL